uniref:DUF4168 domain-containing protein n=1 Tax=Prevotella sp. GTC17253 TaxID=3236793 RepID=A0AB33J165_9BACT
MSLVVLFGMTAVFAEETQTTAVEGSNAFNINFNLRKLAEALSLSSDQRLIAEDVHKAFAIEMSNAAVAPKDDKRKMVERAVANDIRHMRYVLNQEQFDRYVLLLNTTLENRGLKGR